MSQSLVIRVHGTFAADGKDEGLGWWQKVSPCHHFLEAQLPSGVVLSSEVFHWSGNNGERPRNAAAKALLRRLIELEERRQAYHLIGHSHGGLVIWRALQEATRCGRRLEGLRSWSTVGTPFLHFQAGFPALLVYLIALSLTTVLLAKSGLYLYDLLSSGRARPQDVALIEPALGWAMTLPGPVTIAAVFAAIVIGLGIWLAFAAKTIEALSFTFETSLSYFTFSDYGAKWLGIWSQDDEAINGLSASIGLRGNVVPRYRVPEPVFDSDRLLAPFQPYLWFVLRPTFNWVLAPLGDRFIWSQVKSSLAGNDRPGVSCNSVTVGPLRMTSPQNCPALSDNVALALRVQADTAAGPLAPAIRLILGQLAFSNSPLQQFAAAPGPDYFAALARIFHPPFDRSLADDT